MAKNQTKLYKLRRQKRLLTVFLTVVLAGVSSERLDELQAKEPTEVEQEAIMQYLEDYEKAMQMLDDTYQNTIDYGEMFQINYDTLSTTVEKSTFDTYLRQYSYYFNFDQEKVIEVARKLTDDYTNGFQMQIKGTDVCYGLDDPETFAMMFVCGLYRERGEISSEYRRKDFLLSDELEKITRDEDGNIVLRNGQSFSVFLGQICDILSNEEMFKVLALSISNSETKSQNPTVKSLEECNNPGGLKGEDGFYKFPSLEAGIISFAVNLKRIESVYEGRIHSFEQLSKVYVNGNLQAEPALDWTHNVKWFYNHISNDMDTYFMPEPTQMVLEYKYEENEEE